MAVISRHNLKQIKSPLNYIGGKTRILDQILPLFPKGIDNFIDLFAGGCNVGINVNANKVYFNDNLTYLIEMYKKFQENDLDITILHIENRIREFELSLTNNICNKLVHRIFACISRREKYKEIYTPKLV